jgi:hypothetical protein
MNFVKYSSYRNVFKMNLVIKYRAQHNNYLVLWYKNKIRNMSSPDLTRDTQIKVTLVARPLLTPVVQNLFMFEHSYARALLFCGYFWKKEFIRKTRKAWRNWNTILKSLLPTLTQKHFAKLRKHTRKGGFLSSIKWWTFSASAVRLFCKLFVTNTN